jgi:hypothetical protein
MAKTIQVAYFTPVVTTTAATEYWALGNGMLSKSATEANRQIVYRTAGTLSKLFVRLTANAATGSSTVTVRKNAADGNQTVSIGAGATGVFEDTVNTDAVASTDLLDYKSVTGSGGALTISIMSTIFDATTNTVSRHLIADTTSLSFATISVSRYNPLAGQGSSGVGAETSARTRIRDAGTLKNMQVYISANTSTVSTTVRSRKNGAAGNISVSIGSTATGLFEDTANTDTLAVGDDTNSEVATGTNAGLTLELIAFEFETTSSNGVCVVGRPGAYLPGPSVTSYFPIGGALVVGATEANTQVKARETFTFSDLTLLVTANTITATSTLTFRVNGADGNQSVSIGSSATGTLSDATNTDVVAATDLVNTKIVTGATGTNITIRNIEVSTFLTAGVTVNFALLKALFVADK